MKALQKIAGWLVTGKKAVVHSLAVFLLWTLTSFLCHYCAKIYLTTLELNGLFNNDDIGRVFHACTITTVQLAVCLLVIDVKDYNNGSDLNLARMMHSLATLATNLSMSMMFASQTFAIKMLEPITSAVTQYVMLGTPLPPFTMLCLPVIVGGAIVFSGNPLVDAQLSYGVIAAFASNIILAIRNVILRGSKSSRAMKMTGRVHLYKKVIFTILCIFLGLYTVHVTGYGPKNLIIIAFMCFLSAIFHVTYSYVSAGLVLSQLSVVSHAVANIMKRTLVVLLLYAVDTARSVRCSLTVRKYLTCMLGPLILLAIVVTSTHFIATLRDTTLTEHELPVNIAFLTDRMDHTFTHFAHTKMALRDLEPDLKSFLPNQTAEIQTFLKKRLLRSPAIANEISKKLKTHIEITKEAQRIHFNMLGDALKKYKYAVLLDIASFENKGDPCITVGEIYFLARIHLEVLYYCSTQRCKDANLVKAWKLVQRYPTNEIVVLVHGGGNIVGYAYNDILRFKILELFKGYQVLVFPQSIWIQNFSDPHFEKCKKIYCCNENVTFVLRDKLSYDIARRYFNGTSRLLMAPDMAFQIGPMDRFLSPVFDVMWIKRNDGEKPGYKSIPEYPDGLRVHVSDWRSWPTPKAGSSLERAFYICTNGFFCLQRGRVLVTDRLHGHILATLMNIPHVLIDNKAKKLSSYHRTWTKSLENTLITNDAKEALDMAIYLLKKYDAILPPRVPFLNLSENFKPVKFNRPDLTFV